MLQKLTKHGNGLALEIDPGVLDLLQIDAETPLDVSTDGQVLIITPIRDTQRRTKFEQALAETNRKYGRALKRLAE